jgi:hypothetical protein
MSDITRYRGDTSPIQIVVKNPDGSIRDVDGESFLLTVSAEANPQDTTGQVFQSVGSIQGASVDGRVDFPVTSDAADNIGTYYFDIEKTDGDGKVQTIEKGQFIFLQDITKEP